MLTVDISLPDVEELHKLVQDGTNKGFLTYDEIVAGLEEVDLSKEQIEDFYTYLIDHSIELVEGEQHKHPPHEQPALAEEERGPQLYLSVEPSLDSLRLYLREMESPAADRRPGGVPGQADRARGHGREDAHDRGQPEARRLDREELPGPRALVPRPDSGGARSV